MAINNYAIQRWAQKAFNKYNGSYTASEINLYAVDYLYGIRNDGDSDPSLAIASHYIHCRYISSQYPLVGDAVGAVAALGYDVVIKGIETIVKKYSSKELVHKFGQSPTSAFSPEMILWDIKGFSDGGMDFIKQWGKVSLYAPSSATADDYNRVINF